MSIGPADSGGSDPSGAGAWHGPGDTVDAGTGRTILLVTPAPLVCSDLVGVFLIGNWRWPPVRSACAAEIDHEAVRAATLAVLACNRP